LNQSEFQIIRSEKNLSQCHPFPKSQPNPPPKETLRRIYKSSKFCRQSAMRDNPNSKLSLPREALSKTHQPQKGNQGIVDYLFIGMQTKYINGS